MLSADEPEVINCLSKDFKNRSIAFRGEVLSVGATQDREAQKRRDRLKLEPLLASELLDDASNNPGYSSISEIPLPELGDLAAYSLAKLFPEKYPFKASKFRDDRRHLRLKFESICRRSMGLPPIPPPVRKTASEKLAAPGIVTHVFIIGETPTFHAVSTMARQMLSKRMTYERFEALATTTSYLHIPKQHFCRFLFSRDSPEDGITLRIDFSQKGINSSPQLQYLLSVNFDNQEKITVSGAPAVTLDPKSVGRCLASKPGTEFDIELDIWSLECGRH